MPWMTYIALIPFSTAWTGLATAAVTCIAPAVGWFTFWTTQRERLAERTRRRLRTLDDLREAVSALGKWAQKPYEETAHNYDWYNPGIKVIEAVPQEHIDRFLLVSVPGEFARGLTTAAARLQAALERLNELVPHQNDLCRQRGHTDDVLGRLHVVLRRTQERGAALTEAELAEIIPNAQDRAWVQAVYEGNRTTYVRAIGTAGGEGLHEAGRAMSAAIKAEQVRLQAGRESRWMRLGHGAAWLLVAVGGVFLIEFLVLAPTELRRAFTTTTMADSISKPTPYDTSHPAGRAARSGSPSPAPTRR